MAQIPGSVPLTGKVAPTDTTDTFATHIDIYGEGGYMTVADQAERDAITTERRKQGMAVFQNSTNEMYILQGGVANTNWTLFSGGGGNLAIEDEGTQLTAAAAKINFTGAGVSATNSGNDVTVDIPGGGGSQDLQSVLENGSQFTLPFPYTGGLLDINYSGATGNPFNPTVNSSGIRIKQDILGGGAGESIYIASSGSADLGWISLHAQGVNSFPTVDYSRINILQGGISIDTNNSDFADTEIGDSLCVVGIATGAGGGNTNYTIGTQPGVQNIRLQISDAQVQTLHSTPVNVISIPAGKRLQVLSVMAYLDISYTNNRTLQLYYDGCNNGGGNTAIAFEKSLFTGMGDNTGAYIPVANTSASWGFGCSFLQVKLDLASGPPQMTPAAGITLYIAYLIIDP